MKLLSVVAALGVCTAMAMAADLPKEGTFSGTYMASGTYKSSKVGDRYVVHV